MSKAPSRSRPLIAAAVGAGVLLAPPARADPGPVPDLSGYRAVDLHGYGSFYNYPTTGGTQFTTPGGYRCRITFTGKANGRDAQCWGALPGTAFNVVGVRAWVDAGPGAFANVTPADMETYHSPPSRDTPVETKTVDPRSYTPLPAGSKITYPDSGTCAVTATTTSCVLGQHGFVLDPAGSRTF
jgi:hypothetical protein